MDKPADPVTPSREVYQHFLAVLKKHGRKDSTPEWLCHQTPSTDLDASNLS